jgi:hypothetical protein
MVGSGRGDGCGAFFSLFRLTMVPEWMQGRSRGWSVFDKYAHQSYLIWMGIDSCKHLDSSISAISSINNQSTTLSRPTLLSCRSLIRDQLAQFYDFCPSDQSYSP